MMEVIGCIKAFAVLYNSIVDELERVTPTKKIVDSVCKGFNFILEENEYTEEEIDVVDEDKQIIEEPNLPTLECYLEKEKQFMKDCDKMILSGEDVLFRSLLRLFKRLQYFPTDSQLIDKNLYDAKIIVDMVLYLGVHIIGNYESIGSFFDAIEERRALLLKPSQDTKQKEKEERSSTLPEELETDEAKELLQNTIAAGLCDNTYKWLKSKALLAYFADKVSEFMNLGKGEYDGKTKVSWKPFEILFGISGLSGAKRDYQKTGTTPDGYDVVDKLFE